MSDCLFCRIVAEEIPAVRIAETDRAIAFMDIFPAAPGHALVIPRAHADDVLGAADEDLAACMQLAARVGEAAVAELGATGVTFQSLARPDAGQTVFHLHIHVIPRMAGDGFAFPWPQQEGDLAVIEGHAARLRAAL
ncbi:MAG: HIT family protein [Gaiellales bacterium]